MIRRLEEQLGSGGRGSGVAALISGRGATRPLLMELTSSIGWIATSLTDDPLAPPAASVSAGRSRHIKRSQWEHQGSECETSLRHGKISRETVHARRVDWQIEANRAAWSRLATILECGRLCMRLYCCIVRVMISHPARDCSFRF